MKQTFAILSILFLVLTSTAHAQSETGFGQGTGVISLGVGLGSSLNYYSGSSQTPALSLQWEKGAVDLGDVGVISFGGYLGYKGYNYKASGYKLNYYIIGGRSAFHLTKLNTKNLDLYGGLMLSYNYASDNYGNIGYSYGSSAGVTAYVGAHYFFANKLGAMAELGYGVSYLTLGLSFKY